MTGNDILKHAIQLIQSGEKASAQKLLEPYLHSNPHDITAWLWEARTYVSLEQRISVLETCLRHNPNHQDILTVLAALNTQKKRNLPNH
jgi:predicted Zn-dependent protease